MLGGCVNLPKSDVPSAAAAQLPTTWRANTSDGGTTELHAWWNEFSDAQLRALIDKALAQNYDLKAAVERTRQAQALITVARANCILR